MIRMTPVENEQKKNYNNEMKQNQFREDLTIDF